MNDAMPANGMCRSLDWARELLDETKPNKALGDNSGQGVKKLYWAVSTARSADQLYESVSTV